MTMKTFLSLPHSKTLVLEPTASFSDFKHNMERKALKGLTMQAAIIGDQQWRVANTTTYYDFTEFQMAEAIAAVNTKQTDRHIGGFPVMRMLTPDSVKTFGVEVKQSYTGPSVGPRVDRCPSILWIGIDFKEDLKQVLD